MRLKSDYFWIPWLLFSVMVLLLASVLIVISPLISKMEIWRNFVNIVNIMVGIFIICGLGLMLVEKSRFIGFLIVAISILSVLLFTIIDNRILLNSLAIGLCVGVGLTGFFIYKIRFDWLAKTLKYLIDILLIFSLTCIISVMINSGDLMIANGYIPYFVILIVLAFGLWYFFIKNLCSITSSDVFIFGPTGSGKSSFIAELGIEIAKNQGFSQSYIFSQNPESPSRLSIIAMVQHLQNGIAIESFGSHEMGYYEIQTKNWGSLPLNVTSLDYTGTLKAKQDIEKISKNNYNEVIQYFSQFFTQSPSELKKDFENIQFLWDFKNNHEHDFFDDFDFIVPAFVYAKLIKAGKIIFLLDGEKIDSSFTVNENWISYIDGITRLINELGENKDYAFVITKSDMIQSKDKKSQNNMDLLNHSIDNRIRNSLSDSKEADELEKDYLEQLFKSNLALKNIFNEITSEQFIKMKYINGFLLSIDASKREGNLITGYHPWRMNKIVNYCFKF